MELNLGQNTNSSNLLSQCQAGSSLHIHDVSFSFAILLFTSMTSLASTGNHLIYYLLLSTFSFVGYCLDYIAYDDS